MNKQMQSMLKGMFHVEQYQPTSVQSCIEFIRRLDWDSFKFLHCSLWKEHATQPEIACGVESPCFFGNEWTGYTYMSSHVVLGHLQLVCIEWRKQGEQGVWAFAIVVERPSITAPEGAQWQNFTVKLYANPKVIHPQTLKYKSQIAPFSR